MSNPTDEDIIAAFECLDTPEVRADIKRLREGASFFAPHLSIAYISENFPDWPPEEFRVIEAATPGTPRRYKPPRPKQPPQRQFASGKFLWDDDVKKQPRAPYRFVPLDLEDRTPLVQQTALDKPLQDGLCTDLTVTMRFDTPFLIGAGENQEAPFKLGKDWAIPGATLRGWLRATVEPLVFGRLSQINAKHRFALRDFNHDIFLDFANKSARPEYEHLNAGWLLQTDDGLAIVPVDHWALVDIDNIDASKSTNGWANTSVAKKYERAGITGWDADYTARPQQYFTRFIDGHDNETFDLVHDVPPPTDTYAGYLVVAGGLPGRNATRRYEYAFLNGPMDQTPVLLKQETLIVFDALNPLPSQNRRDSRRPVNAWDAFEPLIRNNGAAIPVFYSGDLEAQGQDFSFGFTKLYRLPHEFSVGDKAPKSRRLTRNPDGTVTSDIADALFGYVHEAEDIDPPPNSAEPASAAHKGRIAVGFARPTEGSSFKLWPDAAPVPTIQGAPKPSFAPFYLVGPVKDWSDPHARLAGRKRYIPRAAPGATDADAHIERKLRSQAADSGDAGRVGSNLRFLKPTGNGAFMFHIRLHNVSPFELGAVLWALTFGGDAACRHMIGRGKPFGAGQFSITTIDGDICPNDQAAAPSKIQWRAATADATADGLMIAFVAEMDNLLGGMPNGWAQSEPVQAALALAQPIGWSNPAYDYLPFERNGNRFKALRDATGARRNPDPANGPPNRLLPWKPSKSGPTRRRE